MTEIFLSDRKVRKHWQFPKSALKYGTGKASILKKESIWKDDAEREDSIQWRAAQHFIDGGFDIVFDDDSAGEAADLVCLKEERDHIRLALVHCKFAGGERPGERVKDVVEVCSQAVRSAKWKWKFRDLCRHFTGREKRLAKDNRFSRFLTGRPADLTD